jgi:hypothetical protein
MEEAGFVELNTSIQAQQAGEPSRTLLGRVRNAQARQCSVPKAGKWRF